jgi:hypothetical protein
MNNNKTRPFRIDRQVVKDKEDEAIERASLLLEEIKEDIEIAFINAKDSAYSDILNIASHGVADGLTNDQILQNIIDFCISATQEYLYDDWFSTGEAIEVEDGTLADLADGFSSEATEQTNEDNGNK